MKDAFAGVGETGGGKDDTDVHDGGRVGREWGSVLQLGHLAAGEDAQQALEDGRQVDTMHVPKPKAPVHVPSAQGSHYPGPIGPLDNGAWQCVLSLLQPALCGYPPAACPPPTASPAATPGSTWGPSGELAVARVRNNAGGSRRTYTSYPAAMHMWVTRTNA